MDTKQALDHYLAEHEASDTDRAAAYLAYAKGDEEALATALDAVKHNGELLMESIGNPCEPVPTEEEPAKELPNPEDLEEFDPDEDELEAYIPDEDEPHVPGSDQDWWKEDKPSHWSEEGESWKD